MNSDSFILFCLVMWKISTFIVPCIAFGFGVVWLLKKCGIDL